MLIKAKIFLYGPLLSDSDFIIFSMQKGKLTMCLPQALIPVPHTFPHGHFQCMCHLLYSGTPVWYNNSSKVTAELKAHYSLYELLFIVFIVFMNS